MREFQTAVKEATEGKEKAGLLEFKVDGKELRARDPRDGQLAMLMASVGRYSSTQQKIAGIIDFFIKVMDEESAAYITDRLLDYDDVFGLEEVEEIMSWMIEEWTGRPTQPPSVSTQSQ